ncbi:hypothetical protein KIPB_011834, partial [Kipferlia bialata]
FVQSTSEGTPTPAPLALPAPEPIVVEAGDVDTSALQMLASQMQVSQHKTHALEQQVQALNDKQGHMTRLSGELEGRIGETDQRAAKDSELFRDYKAKTDAVLEYVRSSVKSQQSVIATLQATLKHQSKDTAAQAHMSQAHVSSDQYASVAEMARISKLVESHGESLDTGDDERVQMRSQLSGYRDMLTQAETTLRRLNARVDHVLAGFTADSDTSRLQVAEVKTVAEQALRKLEVQEAQLSECTRRVEALSATFSVVEASVTQVL